MIPLSIWRKSLKLLFLFFLSLISLEIALRIGFGVFVSWRLFFWGTPIKSVRREVGEHGNVVGDYFKYFPHERKSDYDEFGNKFYVTMNDRGFRGPDFSNEKKPGVVRVLTLGASSTFGYHGRDDETYPHYLEVILEEKCKGHPHFEVINFGIPHLTPQQISSLFVAEGVPLKPDVVTFYEGYNQTIIWRKKLANYIISLREIFMTVFALDEFLLKIFYFDAEDVEFQRKGRAEIFLKALQNIKVATDQIGARFFVVSQQMNAQMIPREESKGISYEDEIKLVEEKLKKEKIHISQLYFLLHRDLMLALKGWALTNNVPYIDGIAALDKDRDTLLSWVHISPRGNRILAEAIAEQLQKYFC